MYTVNDFLQHMGVLDEGETLAHYGVKGMKWGVRKDRRRSTKSASKKSKTTPPNAQVLISRRPNTFTNNPNNRRVSSQELQRQINRLRLEEEYRRLTTPQQRQKARSWQKELLASIPEKMANAAVDVSVNVGKSYLEQILKVKINDKVSDGRLRVPTKEVKEKR